MAGWIVTLAWDPDRERWEATGPIDYFGAIGTARNHLVRLAKLIPGALMDEQTQDLVAYRRQDDQRRMVQHRAFDSYSAARDFHWRNQHPTDPPPGQSPSIHRFEAAMARLAERLTGAEADIAEARAWIIADQEPAEWIALVAALEMARGILLRLTTATSPDTYLIFD